MVNCPALEAAYALIRSTLRETPAIAWLSLAALSQEQQRTAGRRVRPAASQGQHQPGGVPILSAMDVMARLRYRAALWLKAHLYGS